MAISYKKLDTKDPMPDDVKDEDWDRIMGVNLKGPFQCARAARQFLESSEIGVIVNNESQGVIIGPPADKL